MSDPESRARGPGGIIATRQCPAADEASHRQRRFARFLGFLSLRGSDPVRIPSPGSVIPTGRRED
jgi:hypothetical protein